MPYTCGECGSSSVSQRAWCLRWIATHSFVTIAVVSQVQKRKKCDTTGCRSTPRWAAQRCRYSVTEKMVSCVTIRKYTTTVVHGDPVRPCASSIRGESDIVFVARKGGRRKSGIIEPGIRRVHDSRLNRPSPARENVQFPL